MPQRNLSLRAIPEEFRQSIIYKRFYSLRSDLFAFLALSRTKTTLKSLERLEKPIFIISIPGTLHLVELCLRFIPSGRNVVLIANGLSDWELFFAREKLAKAETFEIPHLLEHGYVIDLLLASLRQPFSLLDFDCFVFNQTLFAEMGEIPPGKMMNAIFSHYNPELNLSIPQTFMLTLNPRIIRPLQKKYHAPSKKLDLSMVTNLARHKLTEIGVDPDHYPLESMAYFDTIHLWYALGIAEGLRPAFVRNYQDNISDYDEVFHVGSSSSINKTHAKYYLRGSYFWRRALEECPYSDLRSYYLAHYQSLSSEELLQKNPTFASQIRSDFFINVDRIFHSACK